MEKLSCSVLLLALWLLSFTAYSQCVSTGFIVSAAGTTVQGYSGDGGPASNAKVNQPLGMTGDADGNIYFADGLNHIIRKVDASGIISTIAGIPGVSGYNQSSGFTSTVTLSYPNDVAVDAAGNIYLVEGISSLIRKVDPVAQTITLIGGMPIGGFGYGGDGGPATSAKFQYPSGIGVNSIGEIYIADRFNHRIRKIDASGIVTTVAGNGVQGYSGDGGPGTSATINSPLDIAIDGSDNVYFIDLSNNAIRKIDAVTGIITTVAGTGASGFSGDGGPATSAALSNPQGISIANDDLYISDQANARIRKVDASTQTISTIMGKGTQGYPNDNDAASSANINPFSLYISPNEDLYYSEWINHRIVGIACPASLTFYEAECSTVGGNWLVINHPAASNGSCLVAPGVGRKLLAGPTNSNDIVRLWVVLPAAGDYDIFARCLAHNTFNDELWVRVNNGTWMEFSNLKKGFSFKWTQLHDGDVNSPISVPLNLGLNTIDIGIGEDGVRVDKVSIALSGSTAPLGIGDPATNCSTLPDDNDLGDDIEDIVYPGKKAVAAYPNPFIATFSLDLAEDISHNIRILNALGQEVWQQEGLFGTQTVLDLQDLPAGIYMVDIENAQERKSLKIQKINP